MRPVECVQSSVLSRTHWPMLTSIYGINLTDHIYLGHLY
jgi:hypothetical protein